MVPVDRNGWRTHQAGRRAIYPPGLLSLAISRQYEVDSILERDGMLYPFEIKLTDAPNRRISIGHRGFPAGASAPEGGHRQKTGSVPYFRARMNDAEHSRI